MAKEIERKFLLRSEAWRASAGPGTPYRQGYLSTDKARTVRVRLAGEHGYLTVKGITVGASRDEFEYEIPAADARAMLDTLCERSIEKTRYRIAHEGHTWEVDAFAGANAGLVVAEIELASEDEAFARPAWLGEEVTADPRLLQRQPRSVAVLVVLAAALTRREPSATLRPRETGARCTGTRHAGRPRRWLPSPGRRSTTCSIATCARIRARRPWPSSTR